VRTQQPSWVGSTEPLERPLEDGELALYLEMCQTNAGAVAEDQTRCLAKHSRQKKEYPQTWRWEGARAPWTIAVARLSKLVNDTVPSINFPVNEAELSVDRLKNP